MPELEISNKKSNKAAYKTNKKMIRVDLTPMVDLGFLLITFFVFTTTMAKATVMEVKTPYDSDANDPVCNSCALTVLLARNNDLYYYSGALNNAVINKSDYHSIRDVIQQQKRKMQRAGRDVSQLSLIIKATDSSTFRNFVDIVDEVTINDIKRYYVTDITPEEKIKINN